MKIHLSTTTNEVVARLNKNRDADVQAFDAVYDHILKMADALSDGIIKQFPEKFGSTATATTGRTRQSWPCGRGSSADSKGRLTNPFAPRTLLQPLNTR